MIQDVLKLHGIKSQAQFVEYGYGQVEPNHLSAQRTAQIYAQLPANKDIAMLEQGQFVKYDYAAGEVNFTGKGEWMLVFNEIKLYREHQLDCEFAMIKDNYDARVYSPLDHDSMNFDKQSRYYGGKDAEGNEIEKVTAPADIYELDATEDPFHFTKKYSPKMMKPGTTMVPRVFKTNVGDIYTTNCVNVAEPALGDMLAPAADGYLAAAGDDAAMKWQVVKVYTLADRQKAVKIMRVA
jgi:hypothetical protein